LRKNNSDNGEKKCTYPRDPFDIFSTSLSNIMTGFISILPEVIEEPANDFLVIVALLAFDDDLQITLFTRK
jgi:hypothetical protein